MQGLNRKKLIEKMTEGGINKLRAKAVVETFIEIINTKLSQNYNISIRGFGLFYLHFTPKRKIKTNFMKAEKILPKKLKPRFKPFGSLIKMINYEK